LPVVVGTTLVNTYKSEILSDYISYVGLSSALNFGYRQAITKQLFLEANVTLIALGTNLYSSNKRVGIAPPYTSFLPGIGLKAAYTFK
jgi:hypothetical protein